MTISLSALCGIGDEAAPDLATQVRIHRLLNMTGIEIRTLDGRWLHEINESEVSALGSDLIAAGLSVPVVDTPIGNWARSIVTNFDEELELLSVYARRASLLGCTQLRIMSYPNFGLPERDWAAAALDRVARLADAAGNLGVRLLHENCAGWAGKNPESTIRMLEHVGTTNLSLIFDIGNGASYGYESFDFLQSVLPWVVHVHIKDAVVGHEGAIFVLPGEGECRVLDCLALLHTLPRMIWLSLEPHILHVPHQKVSVNVESLSNGYLEYANVVRVMVERVCEVSGMHG